MSLSVDLPGRLLVDPPLPGPWNMAVDEVLLENASRGQLALRFYSWAPTTISLGYFQQVDSRRTHAASQACPLVRRASGGGAIVHDDSQCELTYSVALPGGSRSRHLQRELYDTFHNSLIETLTAAGVAARRCTAGESNPGCPPFLCFQRFSEGDVMVGQHKVLGSAQRRLLTAMLQQGSVLLSQSVGAPELPGIAQVSQVLLTANDLRQAWLQRLAEVWPINWRPDRLSAEEQQRVAQKANEKYGHPSWTNRR